MLGVWSIMSVASSTLGACFTAALAESLACYGKRVLLFELAPDCPTVDIILGVSHVEVPLVGRGHGWLLSLSRHFSGWLPRKASGLSSR